MFIATKRLLFNKNKNLKYNITENETSHITDNKNQSLSEKCDSNWVQWKQTDKLLQPYYLKTRWFPKILAYLIHMFTPQPHIAFGKLKKSIS